jgi:hypothetical protein
MKWMNKIQFASQSAGPALADLSSCGPFGGANAPFHRLSRLRNQVTLPG